MLLTIGSEGGFSSDEIAKFKEAKFKVIHLGKTILRSETAAISLISKVK
ncbi:RsmE family RNA methyltransferase [Mycoplasmopsis synoviae]